MDAENDNKRKQPNDSNGDSRQTINFQTLSDKNLWNEQLKTIQNAIKLMSGVDSLARGKILLMSNDLAIKHLNQEGYKAGEPEFAGRYFPLLEAQNQGLMNSFKELLKRYDSGLIAERKVHKGQVMELEETLAEVRNELQKELDEKDDRINVLENINSDLLKVNQVLKKDYENLVSIKQANEKNVQAWEREQKTLNEKIGALHQVSDENAELLKKKREYQKKIEDLERELTELKHRQQLQLKEAEINFQKELSSAIAVAAASSEQKVRQDLDLVISDLKGQVAEFKDRLACLSDQMKSERKEAQGQINAARAEERAKADKDSAKFHEMMQEILKNRMPAGVQVEFASATGNAAEKTTENSSTRSYARSPRWFPPET